MKEMKSYEGQKSPLSEFGKVPSDKILSHFQVPKTCECGNYEMTSTKGVIISDCKNCGGTPPRLISGK